jgi:hypothetical protein
MSDMRDKQPPVREFTIGTRGNQNYEAEITAWTYHSIKSEDVLSPKLIYHFRADNFDDARRIIDVALQTIQAMHDIWQAKIVRIEEKGY